MAFHTRDTEVGEVEDNKMSFEGIFFGILVGVAVFFYVSLKEKVVAQQKQIDDLKRELEEVKRKLE